MKGCEHYLALCGHLPGGWEVVMEDWLDGADDWMAAGEFWTPVSCRDNFKSPIYSEVLLASIRALWYMSQESTCE